MTKLVLQPTYVLHSRPFKETSLIVEALTKEEGRHSILVKGAKRPKSRIRGLLTPFVRLMVSAVGRHELLTLTGVESTSVHYGLRGQALMSGLYLNELIMKVVPKFDPHPVIFDIYEQTLVSLQSADSLEVQYHLRLFEFTLLKDLGYGLDFETDAQHLSIEPNAYYNFKPEEGLVKVSLDNGSIKGAALLKFALGQYDAQLLKEMKRLMRHALAAILGGQRIHTRDLARQFGEKA